jgi:hypothetical protein
VETSLKLKEAPLANTGRYDSLREAEEAEDIVTALVEVCDA